MDIGQLQFLDRQLLDAQFTLSVDTPDQFACGKTRRATTTPEQGTHQSLHPTWPRAWPDPAVQFAGIQMIRNKVKAPIRSSVSIAIAVCYLSNASHPHGAKTFHSQKLSGRPPVCP